MEMTVTEADFAPRPLDREAMKQVRLTAKTGKGKTRIGNSGAIWNVDRAATEAVTPKDQRIFIRSMNGRDFRWVHPSDDVNFTVEFL